MIMPGNRIDTDPAAQPAPLIVFCNVITPSVLPTPANNPGHGHLAIRNSDQAFEARIKRQRLKVVKR
jgi:hypothetical protein